MQRVGSLSFFFPAYNEEMTVEAVAREGLDVLPRLADRLEVVVVDDGSTDRTGEIVDRHATEDARDERPAAATPPAVAGPVGVPLRPPGASPTRR